MMAWWLRGKSNNKILIKKEKKWHLICGSKFQSPGTRKPTNPKLSFPFPFSPASEPPAQTSTSPVNLLNSGHRSSLESLLVSLLERFHITFLLQPSITSSTSIFHFSSFYQGTLSFSHYCTLSVVESSTTLWPPNQWLL